MIKINPEIFRAYDIRGIAGQDIDAGGMEEIGKAHGTYLKSLNVDRSVLGYDNRLTSKEYSAAFISGLLSSGINVIDLGQSLTPIVYWAQYHFKSKGGVMVTGSHNPAEYTGLKLGRDYSDTFTPIEKIKKIVDNKSFSQGEGKLEKADSGYIEKYYQELISKANIGKKFKVVVDASCGTAGKFYPELLRRAGCEVIEQNCELDGNFPSGTPDPTEEKVAKRLAERVIKEGADIGFSYDTDGDRIGVVDEKGGIIWNDILVAIFASDVISKNPGAKIVYNVLCSKIVGDVIQKAGGVPVMWLTGHAFIKTKMKEEKALFGGELSGHFFFGDRFYPHDDGGYASLRMLDYLSSQNKTLSEVVSEFPKYISSPEVKIACPDKVKFEIMKKVTADFKAEFKNDQLITIDGVRVDFDDGMIIVRASQNGPYLTAKFEAKDQNTYIKRKQFIKNVLKKYPEIDWNEGVNLETIK